MGSRQLLELFDCSAAFCRAQTVIIWKLTVLIQSQEPDKFGAPGPSLLTARPSRVRNPQLGLEIGLPVFFFNLYVYGDVSVQKQTQV